MAPARDVESVRKMVQFREGSLILGRPIILNTGFCGFGGFGRAFEEVDEASGAAETGYPLG